MWGIAHILRATARSSEAPSVVATREPAVGIPRQRPAAALLEPLPSEPGLVLDVLVVLVAVLRGDRAVLWTRADASQPALVVGGRDSEAPGVAAWPVEPFFDAAACTCFLPCPDEWGTLALVCVAGVRTPRALAPEALATLGRVLARALCEEASARDPADHVQAAA